jgi:hypothetical protein
MMEEAAALRVAIDLVRIPSRVRQVRSQPLPEGVVVLLRIGAGDPDAQRDAAECTGRSPRLIREAAIFFIEQILVAPAADNYRILGVSSSATNAELRRNMALLLKGMHPDIEHGDRAVFAHRVVAAWDALKTPERRAAYDAFLLKSASDDRPAGIARARARTAKHASHRTNGVVPIGQRGGALALHRPPPLSLLTRVFRFLFAGVSH